jgi:transcriptional regulator with XRE-family HTH domain
VPAEKNSSCALRWWLGGAVESAKTGLAVVQISRIERGKREIRLTTLIRLLDAFDVAPEALLRGVVTPK